MQILQFLYIINIPTPVWVDGNLNNVLKGLISGLTSFNSAFSL